MSKKIKLDEGIELNQSSLDAIKPIKRLCLKYQQNTSGGMSIYLKNAIVVGKSNDGTDVCCTYVDRNRNDVYGYDHITLNVIHAPHKDNLYGTDYKFEFVFYHERNGGQPSFLSHGKSDFDETMQHSTIQMFPNALQLVLEELKHDKEWLITQLNYRTKSHQYRYKLSQAYDKNIRPALPWNEMLEYTFLQSEIERLMWRRPINHDKNRHDEMVQMGEEAYYAREKRTSELVKGILSKKTKNKIDELLN